MTRIHISKVFKQLSIFLKYYCCVSHLKYYKIIFFSWMINEEKYFSFHVSIKPVWKKQNKKVSQWPNLLNFIVLTSRLLSQKKSRTASCEKRRKEMWWSKFFLVTLMKVNQIFQNGSNYPKFLPATFLNYMNQRQEENESYNFPNLTRLKLPKFSQT